MYVFACSNAVVTATIMMGGIVWVGQSGRHHKLHDECFSHIKFEFGDFGRTPIYRL